LNLGIGRGYSVKEIMAAVERETGRDVPHRVAERRPGDPAALVADPSLASRVFGWTPSRDIDTIIRTDTAFHRKNRALQVRA